MKTGSYQAHKVISCHGFTQQTRENEGEGNMSSKILLVDDEASICNMVKLHLQTEGYLVDTVLDAEEAVKALSRKPDLILLDINMPKVNGLEFCKKIRNYMDCPILF